jgi:hypothetical protein
MSLPGEFRHPAQKKEIIGCVLIFAHASRKSSVLVTKNEDKHCIFKLPVQ